MGRFLVVANQTAGSPELADEVRSISAADANAEFVLLVPATRVGSLLTLTEGESLEAARRAADVGRHSLERAGARCVQTRIGDESPFLAIADEITSNGSYDALIICTLPTGASRWLKLDVPRRIRNQFSLPVRHVVAERAAGAK